MKSIKQFYKYLLQILTGMSKFVQTSNIYINQEEAIYFIMMYSVASIIERKETTTKLLKVFQMSKKLLDSSMYLRFYNFSINLWVLARDGFNENIPLDVNDFLFCLFSF